MADQPPSRPRTTPERRAQAHAAAIIYADRRDAAEHLIADAVLTPHYDDNRFSFYAAIGKKWTILEGWGK